MSLCYSHKFSRRSRISQLAVFDSQRVYHHAIKIVDWLYVYHTIIIYDYLWDVPSWNKSGVQTKFYLGYWDGLVGHYDIFKSHICIFVPTYSNGVSLARHLTAGDRTLWSRVERWFGRYRTATWTRSSNQIVFACVLMWMYSTLFQRVRLKTADSLHVFIVEPHSILHYLR